jgi:hypothetical protein
MNKFKVGQNVRVLNSAVTEAIGKIGKVVFIDKKSICPYLVFLGEDFKGHNGLSRKAKQKNDHNRWFCESSLEAVSEVIQ